MITASVYEMLCLRLEAAFTLTLREAPEERRCRAHFIGKGWDQRTSVCSLLANRPAPWHVWGAPHPVWKPLSLHSFMRQAFLASLLRATGMGTYSTAPSPEGSGEATRTPVWSLPAW